MSADTLDLIDTDTGAEVGVEVEDEAQMAARRQRDCEWFAIADPLVQPIRWSGLPPIAAAIHDKGEGKAVDERQVARALMRAAGPIATQIDMSVNAMMRYGLPGDEPMDAYAYVVHRVFLAVQS